MKAKILNRKIGTLRLAVMLMTLSWILLFGFVIQWLSSGYHDEEEIIRRELDRQFAEARAQVMDSALLSDFIDPIMKTRLITTRAFSATERDCVCVSRIQNIDTLRATTRLSGKKMIYNLNISDSAPGSEPSSWQRRSDPGNMVLRSIRLIVGQAIDTTGDRIRLHTFLPDKIDTVMLAQIFADKMSLRGYNFVLAMHVTGLNDSMHSKTKGIHLTGKVFDGSITAVVSGFSWYILRQLLPQVIFALVLLSLTAGSFIFSFRSLRKQEILNNLRNDFVNNITHELKTPVATVRVALESLQNFDMKRDPAVMADYLRMASLEMERLDRLIAGVLNVSLLEEDRRVIKPVEADLKAIALHVLNVMKARLELENTTVLTDMPDEKYPCLVDSMFAEGVLHNLIDNSLKYAGDNPVIHLSMVQNLNSVTLLLSDNGPGIPDEYLERVFEKFFRVPTGDMHNVKGHGLGLSYAAQVMRQHGGHIKVRNLQEGGCEFAVTFAKVERKAG